MTGTGTSRNGRYVGVAVRRVEDRRLLTGRGRFTADLEGSGRPLHAAFARSPLACARLRSVDLTEARAHPAAVAAYAAADLDLAPLVGALERPEFVRTEMPPLATDRVRYVGEPVAVVVAADRYLAEDLAELVDADYDGHDGPVHDAAPDGVLLDVASAIGEVDERLVAAHLLVEQETRSGRTSAMPIEGRACHAAWDDRTAGLVLHVSTQVPHTVRQAVAEVLGLAESRVRVIAPDVGGGFGVKCVVGREECVIAAVAARLRRPVLWTEDRAEHLIASFHGREQRYRVRAGFTADGVLDVLDAEVTADVGAYSAFPFTAGVEPLMAAAELPGPYRPAAYRSRARAVVSNKAPMGPHRGVSRPQIVLVMERLMDAAAARLGLDPIDIRRRNVVPPGGFPHVTLGGLELDEGSYRESLDRLDAAIDAAGWRPRRAAARGHGELVGIGASCFAERTGYGTAAFQARRMAVTPGYDVGRVRMDATGAVLVTSGTAAQGQGHETTFAQIVADALGVRVETVAVRQGDTDVAPHGWGTFASRSVVIGGSAVRRAGDALAVRLRQIAGHLLEAAVEDVELVDGWARVRGTGAALPIAEVARVVHQQYHRLPPGMPPLLEETASYDPPGTFSNAAHAALVAVDAGTGGIRVLEYLVVEDCGVVINPMIVDGQVHGGVAAGIGAALLEDLRYEDGQPLTSLMDYLVPTAAEVPPMRIEHLCTPSAHSATGAKGMGEGGTIGAPAAVLGAVNDALGLRGGSVDAIPIRPADVLRALGGRP